MRAILILLLLSACGCSSLHLRTPEEFRGKKTVEDPPIGFEGSKR